MNKQPRRNPSIIQNKFKVHDYIDTANVPTKTTSKHAMIDRLPLLTLSLACAIVSTSVASSFIVLPENARVRTKLREQPQREPYRTSRLPRPSPMAGTFGARACRMSPGEEDGNVPEPIERSGKSIDDDAMTNAPSFGALASAASVAVVAGALLLHAKAWHQFFSSMAEMMANTTPDENLLAALTFWLFGALIHPIVQPVLFASETLHSSPGPKIGDLMPASFVVGSGAVAYSLFAFEGVRKVCATAAVAALVAYVGAGLDGRTPQLLGDYNIQLDDSYQQKIVKGCPAPDDVQLPTVKDFDLRKYQGRWYWQAVHDWTQFKEVYDTTMDITLTDDGGGYTNNLGIRGPSPRSSPLSWDKSPLANGASYAWSGRVDKDTSAPGVSRETGFGVTFPNYVVDVKADLETGQYEELIQFQCIEVGGVRLYEGIDFMSRSPELSAEQLMEMHGRAERAGLYPYGASPEQMHRVERRALPAGVVDNEWQAMWRAIGIDNALQQLSNSIDG